MALEANTITAKVANRFSSHGRNQAILEGSSSMTTLPTLSATAIESDRVVLRKARDADREGIVEVLTDPEVRAYLGGPLAPLFFPNGILKIVDT